MTMNVWQKDFLPKKHCNTIMGGGGGGGLSDTYTLSLPTLKKSSDFIYYINPSLCVLFLADVRTRQDL